MDDKSLAQLIKSMATTITELETALNDTQATLAGRMMRHGQCIDMLVEVQAQLGDVIRAYEAETGKKWGKTWD